MENRTAGVSAPGADKTPEQIEHDMLETRDSITEKVSALENQVLGTIQTATDTVTDTVQAVKDVVTSAPNAVRDTVKETVAAVKESISSFSVSGCISDNPWAALGTSTVAGFLVGCLLPARRGRSIMARGHDAPAEYGRPGTASGEPSPNYAVSRPSAGHEPAGQGLFGDLFGMIGREVRQLAEQALSNGLATLKQSLNTQVPQMVDHAVHQVTDRVNGLVSGTSESRVSGPNYRASAPATGV